MEILKFAPNLRGLFNSGSPPARENDGPLALFRTSGKGKRFFYGLGGPEGFNGIGSGTKRLFLRV